MAENTTRYGRAYVAEPVEQHEDGSFCFTPEPRKSSVNRATTRRALVNVAGWFDYTDGNGGWVDWEHPPVLDFSEAAWEAAIPWRDYWREVENA